MLPINHKYCISLLFILGVIHLNSYSQKLNQKEFSIELETLFHGRDTGTTWFLPRVCMAGKVNNVKAFMTIQEITGSDYYGPVHYIESHDDGHHWTKPLPVPGLGRKLLQDGTEEAVSDVISKFHPQSKSIISIGEVLFYRNGKFFKDQPRRYPVYIVRNKNGQWSERKMLKWDDPRNSSIYGCGSSQFEILPNGNLIIPVMFRSIGLQAASVTTLLCSFDGNELQVINVGRELINKVNRGLLEPQLIHFRNKYYMTIRAEDNNAYVTVSDDGLNWSDPFAWAWENGEKLITSTTQQHWIILGKDLYLAYTRKDASNENVMRWRSPLYMSKVNMQKLSLIKQTEEIVFPLIGDGINDPKHVPQYGNFHAEKISKKETWILSGEVIQANYKGDLLMAKVKRK